MRFAFAAVLILAAPPTKEAGTTREKLAEHLRAMVKESRAPAELALKQLRGLATKENFKSLGFDSLEELPSAELGHPMPVLMVRLDELREYKAKGDPYKLLHPIPKVVYGVTVKGDPRCGLEVRKQDGRWESSALGIAGPARLYVRAFRKQAEKDKATVYFLIKVPALNETYVGYQGESGVKLVHVRHQAEEKGKLEARPAADVFAELVKLAKEHDGTLR